MSNICPSCAYDNSPGDRFCMACGATLTPTSTTTTPTNSGLYLPTGTWLKQGKYQIKKFISQGGFGITYKGIYCANSATVAIKELWPENGCRQGTSVLWPLSITPVDRKKQLHEFQLEAIYLSRCKSPHIAKVYDCFEENSTIYMVMEFIEGSTLSNLLLNNHQPLDEPLVIKYTKTVAEALTIVHQHNLLHRDIKPDNIMIGSGDRVVLIDFGTTREFIAGKTGDMTVILSRGYAPFEQYSSQAKRYPSTDIYALCASMYELLTGKLPADSADRAQAISNNLPDPLVPPRQLNPNISPYIQKVILTGLKFRVNERIQTAQDFIDALDGKLISPLHKTAKTCVKKGKLTDAVTAYQNCLTQEPDNAEALIELAIILLYHHSDRADSIARKAQQIKPQDGRIYGILGLVSCRSQQWKQAIQQLQHGIKLSPKQAWMHANLGWAWGKEGNWQKADQTIQQALNLDPNSSFALGVKAWISFHLRQWKIVVQAGTQGIFKSQQQPSSVAIALKSWLYPLTIAALERVTTNKSGDITRRLQAFTQQVPNNALALGFKAWYEYRKSDHVSCRQSLNLASQCPEIPDWVMRNGGLIYEHLGDFQKAADWYNKIYQKQPKDAWICYRLGTVLAASGEWHQAKNYLENAVKCDRNLAAAYRNLGWVLLNLRTADGQVKSPREVLVAYRQAVTLYDRQDPQQAQHLRSKFQAINLPL
ncbi:protein kinase [Limnospira fusiformis KN01]|nr:MULTISPECIES: protein kinase [Limnospira]MDC0836819.1 protein kinase [Limnoraphis robusta]MDY7052197.1 protein kinase [Limnospira fusiformis LS22]MDT9186364.1 protein kinase [Limnospira sp. PMC 894.15]MDT9196741.1 protein kinase [Limnospira sp. PMC 1042.18]MDT9232268.1 protein kinase [Limnospira sp. PMC 917.15]